MCTRRHKFDDRNRPLSGLDHVAVLFGNGHAAWVWLTTLRPSLDGAAPFTPPARGEIEPEADAARGDPHGDYG